MEIVAGVVSCTCVCYDSFAKMSDTSLALLFCYCELLLLLGDPQKIKQEKSRIFDKTRSIAILGDNYLDILDDQIDQMLNIFDCIIKWLPESNARQKLTEHFNSGIDADHFLYCLRVCTK